MERHIRIAEFFRKHSTYPGTVKSGGQNDEQWPAFGIVIAHSCDRDALRGPHISVCLFPVAA
eukprot:4477190-Alexandrium_andersonii.AAC.1